MSESVAGRVLVAGAVSGPVLSLDGPLSLWGGVDPATGVILDPRHPDAGASIAGRVLVLPAARGSSSSSSVLAELLRGGMGPLGIVLGEPDGILAIGSVVAHELYGSACPVVVVEPPAYGHLAAAGRAAITSDGRIRLDPRDDEPPGGPAG